MIADLFIPLFWCFILKYDNLFIRLGKSYIKNLSCTRPNKYFVEYSIGYAIEKGEVIMRSNNRCTDLVYIHFF